MGGWKTLIDFSAALMSLYTQTVRISGCYVRLKGPVEIRAHGFTETCWLGRKLLENYRMLRRRVFSFPWVASLFAVALLTAGGLPQSAHADEFGDGAKKFVEVLADDAIRSLAVNDISKAERASRFRSLMLRTFAIKGMGKFVLGRHWRKASDPLRKEYLRLFEDLLVATYAQRLAKYAGATLNIIRPEFRGQRAVNVYPTML